LGHLGLSRDTFTFYFLEEINKKGGKKQEKKENKVRRKEGRKEERKKERKRGVGGGST